MKTAFPNPIERAYWSRIWHRLFKEGVPNTWDYQWMFTCIVNGGLTTLPNRNLVKNIGFGADATHTSSGLTTETYSEAVLDTCVAPSFLLRCSDADYYSFKNMLGGKRSLLVFFLRTKMRNLFCLIHFFD